jgi:hypothetical protein
MNTNQIAQLNQVRSNNRRSQPQRTIVQIQAMRVRVKNAKSSGMAGVETAIPPDSPALLWGVLNLYCNSISHAGSAIVFLI